jgi:hypothetical protein
MTKWKSQMGNRGYGESLHFSLDNGDTAPITQRLLIALINENHLSIRDITIMSLWFSDLLTWARERGSGVLHTWVCFH